MLITGDSFWLQITTVLLNTSPETHFNLSNNKISEYDDKLDKKWHQDFGLMFIYIISFIVRMFYFLSTVHSTKSTNQSNCYSPACGLSTCIFSLNEWDETDFDITFEVVVNLNLFYYTISTFVLCDCILIPLSELYYMMANEANSQHNPN